MLSVSVYLIWGMLKLKNYSLLVRVQMELDLLRDHLQPSELHINKVRDLERLGS